MLPTLHGSALDAKSPTHLEKIKRASGFPNLRSKTSAVQEAWTWKNFQSSNLPVKCLAAFGVESAAQKSITGHRGEFLGMKLIHGRLTFSASPAIPAGTKWLRLNSRHEGASQISDRQNKLTSGCWRRGPCVDIRRGSKPSRSHASRTNRGADQVQARQLRATRTRPGDQSRDCRFSKNGVGAKGRGECQTASNRP